jgi:Sulfotransferase family
MTASGEPIAGASAQRAPDFFIVGHPKCGTTALFEMLRRCPQIYMPDVKETWFFASELRRGRPRERSFKKRASTLEEYLSLFAAARPDQRIGEATPSYLRSHSAAARIAEVQPAARIIAILREPASFLRSLHLQFVQTHVETETDFRKALALEGDRREGRRIPSRSAQPRDLLYSDTVRYVEQLSRYHAVFPPEQVLVLIYDDFRANNEATVSAVLSHLGVSGSFPFQALQANATVRVRSRRLHDMVHSVSVGAGPTARVAKASMKVLTTRRVRLAALRMARRRVVFAEPPPPDENLMLELRRRFKGEVVAASEYLGRDLVSLWGYGELT